MRGLAAAVNGVPIVGTSNLTVNGAQIEEHGGLLEVDVLLRGLLLWLEGIEPDKGEGVDVVRVGGDWEARLNEAKSFEVGLEEIAARREGRIGVTFDVGAKLL